VSDTRGLNLRRGNSNPERTAAVGVFIVDDRVPFPESAPGTAKNAVLGVCNTIRDMAGSVVVG
jgi:hypothetical protein